MKDKLFQILNDWNYWFRDLPHTFSRDKYKNEIAKKIQSNEVIILKGVRRSGKSTLLINEIKRLIQNGVDRKNILFVNFEDQRFNMFDKTNLLEIIKEVYLEYINPIGKLYIMLDEVQNIPAWEKWVAKEYELGNNQLYITGSNSNLLSSEFSSTLSGRYLSIEVYPLNFEEFLNFHKTLVDSRSEFLNLKTKIKILFNEYLKYGGFPKIVLLNDEELKKETLKSYYDSILLRDIVARYRLKNYSLLNELALFLLSNNSTINAYNKLKNNFQTSFDTIKDYMEFLRNAYMTFEVLKFDFSYKKQLANARKIYTIDIGLSNQVSFNISQKIGQNLENIVFLELKRRYNEIFYYKTHNNLEIDFLIKVDNYFELIQVSANLTDEKTLKRELRAFKTAKKELNSDIRAKILTLDSSKKIVHEDIEIDIINILEWLIF